ncbi:hypothetical protein TthWC1_2584 [Thermoanaerobacter thermohydrosulfuricus WC1]|jgi:hypothetical protein|uniref:Uncharacterized protein n=2 Tax=Thermoanaerobacter TaxID=1754 RepID=D3T359_THEIA|nr:MULTISPECIES: hypothetical protein [Thermoanaerobacter]ADD02661.1 hypothetical protein Thit_1403 [Thermoanaerobacter italicus Ab9]EMT37942.1 hypothetical protein TthWC1_2584 [Thermoanaerobacter thermohydrosulfuricus WC1]
MKKGLDWNSEQVKIALEKAKAAYEQVPKGRKIQTLEKTFAAYTGVFRCYDSIKKHIKYLDENV